MEVFEKSETIDPEIRAYVYSLVTALGGRSTYDDSYAIGDEATAVLKDLIRWIRLHDHRWARFDVRRCLAEANLVKGDILEILAQYPEDGTESKLKTKRAVACLQLLAILTGPLDEKWNIEELTHTFHRHVPYLQLAQVGYKRALLHFENAEILRTIVRVALPSMAVPRAERSPNDKRIVELPLTILRNIATITQPQHLPSQGDENEITRSTTIDIFQKQDIFNFLLTLGSGSGDEFQDEAVLQLEVLFHLLKGIDPKNLFMERKEVDNNNTKEFKDLLLKEKAMLDGYKKHAPTRHNRFGTMVWLRRDETNYSTVSGQHAITNDQQTLYNMDKSKKWDKPKFRGKATSDVKETNDFGGRCDITEAASTHLRTFIEDFLDSSFNPLFLALRKLIERDNMNERHSDENKMQYFYLIAWFLNAATARYDSIARDNSKNTAKTMATENNYAYIAAVLDQETFVLLNRSMQNHLDEKRWQLVQSTMLAFTQILLTVQSMSESKDEEDQEIAENIQNRIFYEESTHDRILTLLRGYNRQGFAYLDAVTECTHVFVRMLERYSKVNVDLQIRSKRRARRKKNPQPENGEGATAEANEEADEEAEQEEREMHQSAAERKFDFARFSAKFMNQKCVDTFLTLLHFYADLTPEQLKRCHRYFYRLAFKNELAVLLFRVDILLLFHRLIKGPEGLPPTVEGFKDWEQLVQQVFRRCIKWITKETEGEGWKEMCMIEMLFSKIGGTVFYMQNGFDRTVEKSTPRPPAELDFKASLPEDQRVRAAVGVMLENNKADGVSWVREEVNRAAIMRESWEVLDEERQRTARDTDTEGIMDPNPVPSIFLQPGESEERRLALFKDKHLRLLLTTLGYQRLGVAEDTEASWVIPSELASSQLKDLAAQIQQAEFDPPTFDGKSATDMTKLKGSFVRKEPTSGGPFDDASDSGEGASDADEQMFPPNMREKRKQRAEGEEAEPKKRRRLHRRNSQDPTESEVERRAETRKEKERERNAKIKSNLFITASDDESDAEGDAEFFRLEEQRRQKMKGLIRNQLLKEMGEATAAGKDKKAKKADVRAKAKEVARALGEDEDDLIEGVVSDMDDVVIDEQEPAQKARKQVSQMAADEEMSEDGSDEDAEASSEEDAMPLGEVSGNASTAANKDGSEGLGGEDDDGEDEDVPVNKRPPARRLRAGFVLDDSDDDE